MQTATDSGFNPETGSEAAVSITRPVAAFTPGPWVNRSGRHLFGAEIFSGQMFVAAVMSWEGIDEAYQAEAKANARLIAQAPAMYASLKQFVNAYETGMLDSPADETLANVVADARSALAKVESAQ